MSSWAKPGVECVCIGLRTYSTLIAEGFEAPLAGKIYTVRQVTSNFQGVGLLLVEVVNPVVRWGDGDYEPFWAIGRFRPLITQEQDLALFRHLLSPSPVDVGLVPAGVELDA